MPENVFRTEDYLKKFAGLDQHMAEIAFPNPFTVDDYRRWFTAANEKRADQDGIDDLDDLIFIRQYRGAVAVAEITPTPADDLQMYVHTRNADVDEFSVPDQYRPAGQKSVDVNLIDADANDLPLSWASFVTTVTEDYLGRLMIAETDAQRRERREAATYEQVAFGNDFCLELLPVMAKHRGYVIFREPLTKSAYHAWRKAFKINQKKGPQHVDNNWRLRALAGAVTLVQEFKFRGLDWKEITANKCELMPLEIASFLVETAGVFLSRRLTAKNF